jgi:ATP-binding cassette subfamily F protein 3
MLTVHSISKSFGIDTILKDVSFSLSSGERLGLIGPNGSGKTTLLRILAGQEKPDSGGFHFSPPDLRVAYLEQGMSPLPDETMDGFLGRMAGDLGVLSARLEGLAPILAQAPQDPDLQRAYDDLLAQIEAAAQNASRKPAALAALGLGDMPPDTPARHLSGGQKTRLALAGVLLASPQLLLLDEPTNHLDLDMLEWLEDWLVNSPVSKRTAALIVSHDRAFLDQTVTGILELDPLTHTLRAYAGNYSAYLEHKLIERERHWQEYTDQQEEIARLRSAALHMRGIARFKRGGKADSGDKFAKGFFANRGKGTVARAKHIERRLEQLLTEERIDKPSQTWQMKAGFFEQDFIQASASGRDVLAFEDLGVGYPGKILLQGLNQQLRSGERLALIGPNGAGKTSLVRTIAGLLPPLAGRVRLGTGVKIGYMAQEQETLDPALDALTTIRGLAPLSETAARHFLHQFLFTGDEVFTPVGQLSYGERARLYLACLVAQGHNFLLLDEPINHLDIPSRSRFEGALASFEGTVLAVVHDRYFIEGFATKIWEIRDGRLNVLL